MTTFEERHGRPKPPRVNDVDAHEMYRMALRLAGVPHSHLPLRVYRLGGPIDPTTTQYFWKVVNRYSVTLHIAYTHAEAITYAQQQARKDTP